MKATWIQPDGSQTTLDVAAGNSLMEAATARNIPGIIGECGGSLSCATCHVVVDLDWFARTGEVGTFEDQMLDVAEAERQPTSRLSCQIKMTAALDGIILQVPKV
ncbi:MAG: 2Fe-2S iron-sulfur cluster-binding protein [Cypionkella sp.]